MTTLEKYQQINNDLMQKLGIKNPMSLPRLQKVVINVGIGKDRAQQGLVEALRQDIAKITGQKPVITKSKKAIAGFKLQKGQAVGIKVTLRQKRMFDFIDRLVNAVFPAIRDFKGIPLSSVDNFGNLSIGLGEHTMFPEIGFEQAGRAHGLQITIVPSMRDKKMAIALYRAIGLPLEKEK